MLPTKVFQLHRIAAKANDFRPALESIAFLESGRAVATNGHALLDYRFAPNGEVPKGGSLLRADDAKAALRAFRKEAEIAATFAADGIAFSNRAETASLKVFPLDSQFPSVDHLAPKAEPALEITLNARLLVNVLQTAIAVRGGQDAVPVRFAFQGQNEVVALTVTGMPEGESLTGLVMPGYSKAK